MEGIAKPSERARALGVSLFLEPINRYETHLINSLSQGAEVCRRVASPGLKLLADFFHMNIEDPAPVESLVTHKAVIGHVHVADSTRLLPGYGHLDFPARFKALQSWGYKGALVWECSVPAGQEPIAALRESVRRVREWVG